MLSFFGRKPKPPVAPTAAVAVVIDRAAVVAEAQRQKTSPRTGVLQDAIANSAHFACIATDEKGLIQVYNAGAERLLGYTAGELVDKKTPADLRDPAEVVARAKALSLELGTTIAPGFGSLVFKASRDIEDIYEANYIRRDGSHLPVIVSVTALRGSKNLVIGYLLIFTDNTVGLKVAAEHAKVVKALHATVVVLEQARLAAERANAAKSGFLASMSRELRAPLNAILGFAQLLGSDTPPATPAQQASIDQVLNAGWYLSELIGQILDLAAIESGTLALAEESVALAEVMRDCQAMMAPQAGKRDITLTFPDIAVPLFVRADHTRLKQVLVNLISNAIKFNQPGGVVAVECSNHDPLVVHVSVRDSGPGLLVEDQLRLFQPPKHGRPEGAQGQGAGIGLVMSKRLVELMGGAIGVDSTIGIGSVFWFELGAALEPAEDTERNVASPAAGAPQRTVLYVEDNLANRILVQQLVARRSDLRLLTAANGAVGVALARAAQPDLVLMDISLPGIDGFDALALLRKDPVTSHIPVLAVSANAMPTDIERGLKAGFDQYLTKPIQAEGFMAAVDAALASLAVRKAH